MPPAEEEEGKGERVPLRTAPTPHPSPREDPWGARSLVPPGFSLRKFSPRGKSHRERLKPPEVPSQASGHMQDLRTTSQGKVTRQEPVEAIRMRLRARRTHANNV